MIIKVDSLGPAAAGPISARCPACGQLGTFEVIGADLELRSGAERLDVGHRRCPNPQCKAHIFVVVRSGTLVASYPAVRIDFDSTDIPGSVKSALEEAITCHASDCLTAAAIMIRKTLEELCRDRQANGKDLKERIRQLGTKIVLPRDLLAGLDDLRLLGNDAAHIESREYEQIGKEEVGVGIEFAKEVLKATYQYAAFLGKLRSLKKSP